VIEIMACFSELSCAQNSRPTPQQDTQLNVNWLYGSYVPKETLLEPLNAERRFKLYLRQTYTTRGIFIKTALFAVRDQAHNTNPEWGDGMEGFSKHFASRQSQFIIRNSVMALGNGALGWEPRYDRSRSTGFWPRTRHAFVRNFVTYNGADGSLRPQLFPYIGAFTASVAASAWQPGNQRWDVKGYQAAVTQVPFGMVMNWIGEFAPDMARAFRKHRESRDVTSTR
jgi:hypothetical protein